MLSRVRDAIRGAVEGRRNREAGIEVALTPIPAIGIPPGFTMSRLTERPDIEEPPPRKSGSAASRAIQKNRSLAPLDASAAAFVVWMRKHGFAGDWLQDDLYHEYESICFVADLDPMPLRVFGNALHEAGCRKWQAALKLDGKRHRPMMIHIPAVARAELILPTSNDQPPAAPRSSAPRTRFAEETKGPLLIAA
jgi:hypothetical protein